MNIILAKDHEVKEGVVTLVDRRAEHIIKVLRLEKGDTVRFGVIDGRWGSAVIRAIHKKHPRSVTLEARLDRPINSRPVLDLVVAMARPIMLRRIFSQGAALGIGTFHVIHSNRVEKSFWDATFLKNKEYSECLLHGLEQAVDTRIPEVIFHRRFKPFVEDVLPGLKTEYSHMVLAHPGTDASLTTVLTGQRGRILLVVGPEGGWTDYEVAKFIEAGCVVCDIGSRILKVDTAVVALHARITQICEERELLL